MTIPIAPDKLTDAGGQPQTGTYQGVVDNACFGGLRTLSRWRRSVGHKRWIYLGLFSDELVAGGCVVDLTYLASGFAFALEQSSGLLLDHHRMGPRLRQAVPDSAVAGTARFSLAGDQVTIHSDARPGGQGRRLRVRMGRGRQQLRMDLQLVDDSQRVTPLSAITELPGGHASFTHKSVGLPVQGSVSIGARTIEVRQGLAAVDYTHCLPEHHTAWRWACAAGRSSCGKLLGLNLVSGWNIAMPAENAAWIDGQLMPLGPASFTIAADRWRVETEQLSMRFYPSGERRQDVDLKLIASRYVQPMGRFEGQLRSPGGTLQFEQLYGVTEDHEAAW